MSALRSSYSESSVDIGDSTLRCFLDLDGSSDDSFTLVVYDYALDLDLLRQCRYRQ